MAPKIEKSEDEVVDAASNCRGTITALAKALGVARATANRLLVLYPAASEAFEKERALLVDEAEDVLLTSLRYGSEGNRMKAAMYILDNIPNERFVGRDKQKEGTVNLADLVQKLVQYATQDLDPDTQPPIIVSGVRAVAEQEDDDYSESGEDGATATA